MAHIPSRALVAIAPATSVGSAVFFALGLQGLAAGTENSNETGALTLDELLDRTNAASRSINRTTGALGAIMAGFLVELIGERLTLIGVIVVFAAAALTAALPPLRKPPSANRPTRCRMGADRKYGHKEVLVFL